jgi:hypothetical protein
MISMSHSEGKLSVDQHDDMPPGARKGFGVFLKLCHNSWLFFASLLKVVL